MSIRLAGPMTAKIIEWNEEKGYGYLGVGSQRLFLHRRDFAALHKRPAVGDVISFTSGLDPKGRQCARNAIHVHDGGRITTSTVLLLMGLLVLPGVAIYRLGVDFRWLGVYALVISAITYASYTLDKQRARGGDWRISESWLHLLELLGGWPGAFLAQRRLRHKCSKRSYQVIFWLIVLAWQFAAGDSFQNWYCTKSVWSYIQRASDRGH